MLHDYLRCSAEEMLRGITLIMHYLGLQLQANSHNKLLCSTTINYRLFRVFLHYQVGHKELDQRFTLLLKLTEIMMLRATKQLQLSEITYE